MTDKRKAIQIDARILDAARRRRIDLSRVIEQRLAELMAGAAPEACRAANREAIEAYNRRIDEDGLFGDDWRRY